MHLREILEHCTRNTSFFVRAIVCIFSSVETRQATLVKINVSPQCNTTARVKCLNSLLLSEKMIHFCRIYTRIGMEKGMKLEPATVSVFFFVKILKLITLIRILLSDSPSRAHFSLSRVVRTNIITTIITTINAILFF